MDDRRRSKRVKPDENLVGTVKATVPARVVDISPYGAQVEIPSALRPMVECDVTLPLERGPLRVRARVQRCRATTMERSATAGPMLMYRAGLEFIAIDEATAEVLRSEFAPATAAATDGRAPAKPQRTGPIKIRIDSKFLRDRE